METLDAAFNRSVKPDFSSYAKNFINNRSLDLLKSHFHSFKKKRFY